MQPSMRVCPLVAAAAFALAGGACTQTLDVEGEPMIVTEATLEELSLIHGGLIIGGQHGSAVLRVVDDSGVEHAFDVVLSGPSVFMVVGFSANDDLGNLPSGAAFDLSAVNGVTTLDDLLGQYTGVSGSFGVFAVVGGYLLENERGVGLSIGAVELGMQASLMQLSELWVGIPVDESEDAP